MLQTSMLMMVLMVVLMVVLVLVVVLAGAAFLVVMLVCMCHNDVCLLISACKGKAKVLQPSRKWQEMSILCNSVAGF